MKDDLLFAILVTCVFLSACRKDPKPDVFKITEVETTASSTGAEIKGSYIFNSIPDEMKILYGKDDDLSNALASEVDINGDEFKVVIDGLESKTNYHYCFECITSHSSIKTATKSFMTLAGRPTVITNEIFDIGTDAAKGGGIVTDDGGAMVTSRGICWSHNQNPTTDDRHTTDGDGTGEFASEMTKLYSNTEYYVRAYAANEAGTAYSEEESLITVPEEQEPTGYINGYPYVDLGLPSGLKWAMYNVGASSTTDCGELYAWGEIETKSSYTPENCTSLNLTEDISGDARYDAARAKWNATWRMPTLDEAKELEEYCTLRWVVYNGNEWLMITGPNGNYIFLPARNYYEILDVLYAACWTSTPSMTTYYDHPHAYSISSHNTNNAPYGNFDALHDRWRGGNIRPVSD